MPVVAIRVVFNEAGRLRGGSMADIFGYMLKPKLSDPVPESVFVLWVPLVTGEFRIIPMVYARYAARKEGHCHRDVEKRLALVFVATRRPVEFVVALWR